MDSSPEDEGTLSSDTPDPQGEAYRAAMVLTNEDLENVIKWQKEQEAKVLWNTKA